MKNITKKTVIALVAILSISLVAGNILFAGGVNESSTGLVSSADVAFVSGGFSADTGTRSNQDSNPAAGLISAEDVAFVATPFNGALVASGSSVSGSNQSVVSATDVSFIRNGAFGSDTANLFCVVDGVQVSGKVCVN
jgi:hypothetical protein